ncbi:MAG: glycoside hydrolase family 2 protein [Bacteroidales bacterium]
MSNKTQIPITGSWKFRKQGDSDWMPATIPGSVHTDLMANGMIQDPFYRINFMDNQWIEESGWEYETEFHISEDQLESENIELVFEGLDTYADIRLNGEFILRSNNMFHPWIREVKNSLVIGKNILQVQFSPCTVVAEENYQSAGFEYPANNDTGKKKVSPHIRRSPYTFGWDWCPRMVGCGIWKKVYLRTWNTAIIESVHLRTIEVTGESARLSVQVEIKSNFRGRGFIAVWQDQTLLGGLETKLKKGIQNVDTVLEIQEPRLWWPNGLGKANLYQLRVTLENEDVHLDTREVRTGIRTLELVQEDDETGQSFYFKLNGIPVFMKGANLVPLDYFPHRATEGQYKELILAASQAHFNMLRVWGGGFYEQDILYDLCDEQGILVWQDFMFACSMYPAHPAFLNLVTEEAVFQIKRLRNHSCLALWCGNNEVLEGFHLWGWKEKLGSLHAERAFDDYRKLFHELLPRLVHTFDPGRAYHSSSPSAGNTEPPGKTKGDFHYWDPIKSDLPLTAYQSSAGRFVSEYGFKGYPEPASLNAFTLPSDHQLKGEVMEAHQGWPGGAEMVERIMQKEMPVPGNFEEFSRYSQILQAKAIRLAIESHRLAKPTCMGSLVWQFNDCWPAASWSAIDYYGRRKALHYQLVNSFAPVLLVVQPDKKHLRIFVVSDLLESFKADLIIELLDFSGVQKRRKEKKIEIAPDSATEIFSEKMLDWMRDIDPAAVVLRIRLQEKKRVHSEIFYYFRSDKKLALPVPGLSVQVKEKGNVYILLLKTELHARGVFLSHTEPGTFSDNAFDLAAGQTKEIVFSPKGKIPVDPTLFQLHSVTNPGMDD